MSKNFNNNLVIFHIPYLLMGGAEINILRLAYLFKEFGYDVKILVFDTSEQDLKSKITIESLGLGKTFFSRAILRPLKIYLYLKKERPAFLISFLESASIPSLLASLLLKRSNRHIVSIRGNPQKFTLLYRIFIFLYYRFARFVVIPSCDAAIYLQKYYYLNNIRVIHNPRSKFLTSNPFEVKNKEYITAIGRLIKSKNFDFIIDLVALLPMEYRRLALIGNGPLNNYLSEYASGKGVELLIIQNLTDTELITFLKQKSRILISASETECWPNVIVDSLVAGVPVLAADCDFGPREMIKDGINGYLFPVGSLQDALCKSLKILQTWNLDAIDTSENIRNTTDYLDENLIISEWIKLLENLPADD